MKGSDLEIGSMTNPKSLLLSRGSLKLEHHELPESCLIVTSGWHKIRPMAQGVMHIHLNLSLMKIEYAGTRNLQLSPLLIQQAGPFAWTDLSHLDPALGILAAWNQKSVVASTTFNEAVDKLLVDLVKSKKINSSPGYVIFPGVLDSVDGCPVATPMGCRPPGGSWTHFAPAGGDLAFTVSLPVDSHASHVDNTLPALDWFQVSTSLAVYSLAESLVEFRDSSISCPCLSARDVYQLICLRKVLGPQRDMNVNIPSTASPQWKRLIEHLGWKTVKASPGEAVDLADLRWASTIALPPQDIMEGLLIELSESTGLIPRNLLKSLSTDA